MARAEASIGSFDPMFRPEQSYQWNLAAERQVSSAVFLLLAYMGNGEGISKIWLFT